MFAKFAFIIVQFGGFWYLVCLFDQRSPLNTFEHVCTPFWLYFVSFFVARKFFFVCQFRMPQIPLLFIALVTQFFAFSINRLVVGFPLTHYTM